MIKEKIKRISRYNKLKKLYEKYERLLVPAALVLGVIVDFITFKAIEVKTAFIILLVHVVLSGFAIAYLNFYEAKKVPDNKFYRYLKLASPLIIQFSFGALLSASLIFYWFSGSFSTSWPFIGIIVFLMISNDSFREYYLKPLVQLGVYYFILFSVSSLILPFLFNSISAWIFVASGLFSLVLISVYLHFLSRKIDAIHWLQPKLRIVILVIFVFINGLYFLNIIPPIPLALRDSGVYHSVQRVGSSYVVKNEDISLLQKLIPGQTIHQGPGERIYIFTSIFAPADLNTRVVHNWQFYDSDLNRWLSKSKLSYSMAGGRQDGYRGFSSKSALENGRWRVDVETERGQVIGRIRFTVKQVDQVVELIEEVK